MKTGRIILYWLLLLVPTLIIGGIALNLLRHEQDRIQRTTRDALRDRVRGIADNIALSVLETGDNLTETLREVPVTQARHVLPEWETENPLIRNVFIWDPRDGLVLPDPQVPATREEARFVDRYASLFSGTIAWTEAGQRATSEVAAKPGGKSSSYDYQQKLSPRRQLRELSKSVLPRQSILPQAESNAEQQTASTFDSGCIPWFFENRLHLLLWARQGDDAPVYGVELEVMALLSRLIAAFPEQAPPDRIFALVDDSGTIIHRVGKGTLGPSAFPLFTVPVGACLPHWDVAAFANGSPGGDPAGTSFMLISGLLIGIFVIAILAGGSLLLRQAYANLMDARRKTTFVSNVSHELKTPLTSIRMYAELLHEGRVPDDDKQHRYLQVIVNESQRLTRLVNNVLNFSRLEQHRKKYRPETLDLKELVSSVLENQDMRFRDAGMQIVVDQPDPPIMVTIDRDAFEQVLLNLIDNTVKYAAEGGELTIHIEPGTRNALLHLMDRGPGIPARDCTRVFEQFRRLDDTLTAKQPGTGLGLSIAQRMIQDLGGSLSCRPRPGGGAWFTITVPNA
ncbi:MAG: HAMP domain-containing histidine kinase [Candidatus Pacebacteria bacterium]|nr:HAMP domain-containing histidine kinase [Candidatus Paceibacterota bacterium]